MNTYVALLRAVNVGGTGKLAMSELKASCAELGCRRIETYIASGNVVFDSGDTAETVQLRLEQRLLRIAGRPVGVFVRSAAEMRGVLDGNPFPDCEPAHVYACFLDAKPPREVLDEVRGQTVELIRVGRREIYVYYPSGMGKSRLRIPAASAGTARNMNTVAKLVTMCSRVRSRA
jgi:uncharacterized protein (DUF1697 family)